MKWQAVAIIRRRFRYGLLGILFNQKIEDKFFTVLEFEH